jgi:hypothetical protein
VSAAPSESGDHGGAPAAPAAATFPLQLSFRLPEGGRITITYDAELLGDDRERRVYRVRLGAWRDLTWPPGTAPRPDVVARLDALAGTYARVPYEARAGARLPLKYETLTRALRFFYDSEKEIPDAR